MKNNGSMNRFFRVIWNAATGEWQAVTEVAKGQGKSKSSKRLRPALVAGAFIFMSAAAYADALPTGGTVVGGSATISQSGNSMTINQTTAKMAADWQSFSIGAGSTVTFNQPTASSVALNRVVGADVSVIQGALKANGQVFLINPNGVLFTPTAQVDAGGIVASTLNLSTADFMAGNYQFAGSSSNAIVNQGNITAVNGGTIALIAAKITNNGALTANGGNVLLGAGSQVTLDLGGPVKLQVTQGAIDALIQNGGAIKADGGLVYLTAKAAGELTSTVINNTGVIEAQTLASGEKGAIYLMGGMENDRIVVGGKLDASAPRGGDGGFIETSAAHVEIANDVKITTAAPAGNTGTWLIDPVDFTIAASGGDITGTALGTLLDSNSITIQTATGTNTATNLYGAAGTNGDIFVNDAVSWSAGTTLTLDAFRNININANITAPNNLAGMIFLYGQGTATGDTSTYTASGIVTSPSIQWRKGSDANSTRYAILNGNYFMGNKYIELGICGPAASNCSNSVSGKFGTTNKPSLFFGRSGGNSGIGIIGDSDGFGIGADLRIDYFLPGSPAEQFSSYFTGASNTAVNFATTANSGVFAFQAMGADGTITLKYSGVQQSKLQVTQEISLKPTDLYFNNKVTLTNLAPSALSGVLFSRSFDPDNTVDKGGSFDTIQKIELTIAAGDGANVVSATSASGDAYATASGGKTAKILYYSTDSNTTVGYGSVFFNGANLPGMVTAAAALTKGNTKTADEGIGIIFNGGTLAASASKSFSYITSLDNRDISSILTNLSVASLPAAPTPTSVYVRPIAGSSYYGSTPVFTYALVDIGGNAFTPSNAVMGGTATNSNAPTALSNAGNYSFNYLSGFGLTGSGASNYVLAPYAASVGWTVNKAPLTITANSGNLTYSGVSQSVGGFSASGLVNGQTASVLTGVSASGSGTNAGSYNVVASGTDSNYNLTLNNGTLTIAKANASVTANSGNLTYSGVSQSVGGFSASGLVNGQTASVLTGVSASGAGTNPGSYNVVASGTDSNYNLTLSDGTLTINPGAPQIAAIQLVQRLANSPVTAAIQPVYGAPAAFAPTVPAPSADGGDSTRSFVIGGLNYVFVSTPEPAGASSSASTQERADSNPRSPDGATFAQAGIDPAGFMPVFVVDGGVRLPEESRR